MGSKDKCDVTVLTEDNKTKLTKKYCTIRVIKRDYDEKGKRGGCGTRCSEADTCRKGQMEEKSEQERI